MKAKEKGKGVKVTQLVDFIIDLFRDQTKILQAQVEKLQIEGIDINMSEGGVNNLRKLALKKFGEGKIYDDDELKESIKQAKKEVIDDIPKRNEMLIKLLKKKHKVT